MYNAHKKWGSLLMTLLITSSMVVMNPFKASASAPTISQNMVDQNGGKISVGDILQYTVTIANNTEADINNPTFTEVVPVGTQYAPGSLSVDGSAVTDAQDGDAMFYDSEENALGFNVQTLLSGDQMVLQFNVEVTGSPLYFVNNGNPAKAHRLNKQTGAIETTHVLTGQRDVYGLALTDDGRYLFGVNSRTDQAFRYDLQTETMKPFGSLGLGDVGVPCLDINGGYDLIGADSKKDRLFQINVHSGQAKDLVRLRLDENTKLNIVGGDCAFGADGMMYVMSNTSANKTGDLYLVDPKTGFGYKINNVSQSQFFTGLALDTTGTLFASSNNSNGLYRLNTDGTEAELVGPFGVNHGGGDLATAASQKLKIIATGKYTDDNGNEESVQTTHTTQGDAPVDPVDQSSQTNLVPSVVVDTNRDGVYEDAGTTVEKGQIVEYRVKFGNVGVNLGTIGQLKINIPVPPGTSYLRDSLRAQNHDGFPDDNALSGSIRSDLPNDDSGTYNENSNTIDFTIPNVKSGQSGFVQFSVVVNNTATVPNVDLSASAQADSGPSLALAISNNISSQTNTGGEKETRLIFDSSYSMKDDINGNRKLDVATTAIKNAVSSVLIEGSSIMDLRVYGSEYVATSRESCQDSKRLISSKPLNNSEFHNILDRLEPVGYTPIALSLLRVRDDILSSSSAKPNQEIILISDGVESCGGDPVGAAQRLIADARTQGVNVKIDTIGFDLSSRDPAHAQARQDLQAIANISGGTYFDAS